jgi:hypothetical protein
MLVQRMDTAEMTTVWTANAQGSGSLTTELQLSGNFSL